MTRAYDTRPDLAGYDALTVGGVTRFAAALAVIFGAQFLANQYGLSDWLHAAILLAQVAFGLKVLWIGIRAFIANRELPETPAGPRYADREIRFASPRAIAAGELLAGAFLITDSLYKFSQIF